MYVLQGSMWRRILKIFWILVGTKQGLGWLLFPPPPSSLPVSSSRGSFSYDFFIYLLFLSYCNRFVAILRQMIFECCNGILGHCNKCFCDVAVQLKFFLKLQHIIFDVVVHIFLRCWTCFFDVALLIFCCCNVFFDVAVHDFQSCNIYFYDIAIFTIHCCTI